MDRRTIIKSWTRDDVMWSAEDVSAYLGVPVGTLYQWRYLRKGPRAAKVGRWLRYRPADVRAWFEEQTAPASRG
jgi:predicted DNA-binding transcriptional regulator AlpA